MKDIQERSDIVLLMDSFYSRVKADELLAPVFAHVNWPEHLPAIHNFWSSMMFGDQTYRDNPFLKHKDLAIDPSHFARWLQLFDTAVDENFAGVKADEIKMRARTIAGVFQHKMGVMK